MVLRGTPRRDNRFKPSLVEGRDGNADACAHPQMSHAEAAEGIPNKARLSRSIH
jgi:hypothetical protein